MILKNVVLPLTLLAFAPASFAANGPGTDPSCASMVDPKEIGGIKVKDFPLPDLPKQVNETVKEGEVAPMDIGRTKKGERVISTTQSPGTFFAVNILSQFGKLDARDSVAFSKSLPISFLQEYGLVEMSLLGPDLTKPDPFLDMAKIDPKSPSQDKIDQTNISLRDLAEKMKDLLEPNQRSILDNLLKGNFATSVDLIEVKLHSVLGQFKITREMFAPMLTDKAYLRDIQVLLVGNLEQFLTDLAYIDEVQARYQKTKDALEKLAKEGETIVTLKASAINMITDPFTRAQVEKEFVRFEQRLSDLKSGAATAVTMQNVWDIIRENHWELTAGIRRALNYTIPIIGSFTQMNNALDRQKATRAAINKLDETRDAVMTEMNKRMQKEVEANHQADMQAIERSANAIGELLIGTIMVQEVMAKNDIEKVAKLQASRKQIDQIIEQANAQRAKLGLGPQP